MRIAAGLILLLWGGCFLTGETTPRQAASAAMQQRPNDPWPRGEGHVVYAWPGTAPEYKGYHEPGGSFSPIFASFGVSFWVLGDNGEVAATSDSIPVDQVQQRFVWIADRKLPSIQTQTRFYRASWSSSRPGQWELDLVPTTTNRIVVAFRSVGPSGGALNLLTWGDPILRMGTRWQAIFSTRPANFGMGQEGAPGWITNFNHKAVAKSETGWAYGIFQAPQRGIKLVITDSLPPSGAAPLIYSRVGVVPLVRVPDTNFIASLNANAVHLMMGLISNQTPSGDPNENPLPSIRTGAYTIVALAQAGHVRLAEDLCRTFVVNDFFGPYGSEADSLGLAIWAVTQVANLAHDPSFDTFVYPHVARKAEMITAMMNTPRTIYSPFSGTATATNIPAKELTLVCEPPRDGLIMGRVGTRRSALYVTAISYRALIGAAEMGDRASDFLLPPVWRSLASRMEFAWNKNFATGAYDEELVYSTTLFPAMIASDKTGISQKLQTRWNASHDDTGAFNVKPAHPAAQFAESHQWLLLGREDKVWTDLAWFFRNQSSPGLFSWWEGASEPGGPHRWDLARGWMAPHTKTPSYDSASQALLLQLRMLGYVDETTTPPTLVVGAGIPREWISQTLEVEQLPTRYGMLTWYWRKGKMDVRFPTSLPVRLGQSFGTQITINPRAR